MKKRTPNIFVIVLVYVISIVGVGFFFNVKTEKMHKDIADMERYTLGDAITVYNENQENMEHMVEYMIMWAEENPKGAGNYDSDPIFAEQMNILIPEDIRKRVEKWCTEIGSSYEPSIIYWNSEWGIQLSSPGVEFPLTSYTLGKDEENVTISISQSLLYAPSLLDDWAELYSDIHSREIMSIMFHYWSDDNALVPLRDGWYFYAYRN